MMTKICINNVLNPCSICKHSDSNICNTCITHDDTFSLMGDKFLADTSKINTHFIDQFYELLNNYASLLSNLGLKVEIETYEKID